METALDHLDGHPVDLILLECSTTDTDLVEDIRRLRSHPSDVPIIALTGTYGSDDTAMIEAGVEDCLPIDPLDPLGLARTINHAVARRRTRRSLLGNDDISRVLFEHNPYPVLIYSPDSQRVLAANAAACELYGYSHEEWLTMPLDDIRHPEDTPRIREKLSQAASEHVHLGIWRHRHRDGSTLFVDIHVSPLIFHGAPARVSQLRDVTVERRAIRAMEASERRYRDLFEHSLGFICIHDMYGQILSINPAAADSLGYRMAEVLGHFLVEFMPEQLRPRFAEYLHAVRSSGSHRGVMLLVHRDGSELAWQYHNRLHTEADGSTIIVGYAQDMSDQRAAERALRRSERRIVTITDALPLRVAYLDSDLRFVFVNAAYEKIYERDRKTIVGSLVADVIGADRYARREPYLRRALAGERITFEDESGEGSSYRCEEFTCLPEFSDDQRQVIGIHVMGQDVTVGKLEEQRLTTLARNDELTGLHNRTGFLERLGRALDHSAKQHSLLALMYLDVDGFKQINDTHGHAVGDQLLSAFAQRLKQTVRTSDVIARLGGDEFTVIMEGVAQPEIVTAAAERIVEAMRLPFSLRSDGNADSLRISTSVGIAFHLDESESAPELLQRADAMLYEAKRGGRDRWCAAPIQA